MHISNYHNVFFRLKMVLRLRAAPLTFPSCKLSSTGAAAKKTPSANPPKTQESSSGLLARTVCQFKVTACEALMA